MLQSSSQLPTCSRQIQGGSEVRAWQPLVWLRHTVPLAELLVTAHYKNNKPASGYEPLSKLCSTCRCCLAAFSRSKALRIHISQSNHDPYYDCTWKGR